MVQQKNLPAEPVLKKKKSKLLWAGAILLVAFAAFFGITQATGWNVLHNLQPLAQELGIPLPSANKAGTAEASLDTKALQQQLESKEAEIIQLQSEVENLTATNEELVANQQQLLDEMEDMQQQGETEAANFNEVLKTYEAMSAKAAAPVLTQMDQESALRILEGLKPETVAGIMEKMDVETAAKYTELLAR